VTDYRNDTPQADRLETLLNDKRVQKDASTFLSHTHSEDSGRFAKPQTVIGLDSVQYPTLPENSWTNDPTPTEPPLGIDVNAMEPVGEVGEVQASIDRLEAAAPAEVSVPRSPDAVAESAAGTVQPLGPEDAARQVSFMSDRGAVPNQFKPQRRKPR